MDREVFTYGINAPVNVVVDFLKTQLIVLIARGKLSYIHDARFEREGKFIAIIDEESAYYTTEIFFSPQADNSTRVEIINSEPDQKILAWDLLRSELERSGYVVIARSDKDVVYVSHSYEEPANIINLEHRKVVRALIRAELSDRRILLRELAEETGYSMGRISELKKMYRREPPEIRRTEDIETIE